MKTVSLLNHLDQSSEDAVNKFFYLCTRCKGTQASEAHKPLKAIDLVHVICPACETLEGTIECKLMTTAEDLQSEDKIRDELTNKWVV